MNPRDAPMETAPALLMRGAAAAPDRVVIRHVSGARLTYGEFARTVRRRAESLRAAGVRRGDRVAIYTADSVEAYTSWFATSLAGAIEVPLNPALVGDSLVHPLRDSGARLLLTEQRGLEVVMPLVPELPALEVVVALDEADTVMPSEAPRTLGRAEFDGLADERLPGAMQLGTPELWDTASLIYTSGTTGMPKGVVVPWGQLAYNAVHSTAYHPDTCGLRYSYAAPYHMSGKYNICVPFMVGDPVLLRDGFSLSKFWPEIRQHQCTYVQLFPQLIRLLLRNPESHDDADNPLETVSCLPAVPELDAFKARFGIRHVTTGYGSTEVGGPLHNLDASSADWDQLHPIQSPAGVEVRVADEHDRPVPNGDIGELLVRTRLPWALNAGYWGRPQDTARAWRNGWFHTGDAVRVDGGGSYVFVDRTKDYIRRRGENISSLEVEKYVARHPAVAECAAVAVPSELGEDEIKIVLTLTDGADESCEQLWTDIAEGMPAFMVPRYLEIVNDLPKTPATGRIKKHMLRGVGVTEGTWDSQAAGLPGSRTRAADRA